MKIISYDLGTGGVKAAIYNEHLNTLAKSTVPYRTYYGGPEIHEQKPEDWWEGVIQSTKKLLDASQIAPQEIGCVALSGHSLIALPIDRDLNPILDRVPIWSDTRAKDEAAEFFENIDEIEWYMTTGNGFPPPCYSIFKLMWMKKNRPDVFNKTYKVVGSKDYINLRLTDKVYTDHSYASGTGAFDLKRSKMMDGYLNAAGLSMDIFPELVSPHEIIGSVTKNASLLTGLCEGTAVACGGVDNACMALGSVGVEEGKIYVSLGSSSWIPVNTSKPVLDKDTRPYVFAHIQEGMFTSAFSIFAAGSSVRWVREMLCKDIDDDDRAYQFLDELASTSPIGSNKIFFNPSLAGGTYQDKGLNIRGAFLGLHLGTTRGDLVRAAMEGIALNLRASLDNLRKHTEIRDGMIFCGGGSKSKFWMKMFSDVFNTTVIKTNIDQDAASLGAAAIAARACKVIHDYSLVDSVHVTEWSCSPGMENSREYGKLLSVFKYSNELLSNLGDCIEGTIPIIPRV